MNIVLIGYRCSGKTTVGKMLAGEMGLDFMDMDAMIEMKAGCSIEDMVSGNGWASFRELERRLAEELSRGDNMIIATGGGIVTDQKNVERLRQNGWIVWLNAREEILIERIAGEQLAGKMRPSLIGTDPVAEVKEVLGVRRPLYEKAASFVVDTSYLSSAEVASSIIKAIPADGSLHLGKE